MAKTKKGLASLSRTPIIPIRRSHLFHPPGDIKRSSIEQQLYEDLHPHETEVRRRMWYVHCLSVRAKAPFTTSSALAQSLYKSFAEALQKDDAMCEIHDVIQVPPKSNSESSLSEPSEDEVTNDEEYEVKELVGKRWKDGQLEYCVHWTGCSSQENSWEPVQHLRNAQGCIADFEASAVSSSLRC